MSPLASELFGPVVTTDRLAAATGDRAWITALLDAEAALAQALADTGLAPPAGAGAVVAACRSLATEQPARPEGGTQVSFASAIGHAARGGGNPVIPLIAALRAAAGPAGAPWVHRGATSQDIMDTAAMLVTARTLPLLDEQLARLATGCAALARQHRDTVMAGRTLLQQAVPITFGLKAAGWLHAVLDGRRRLRAVTPDLAAQLGGAAGTLAAYGDAGPAVLTAFARRTGLAEPLLPWHTDRHRVVAIGAALAAVAGTAGKISRDVALLMQTEVAEASEPSGPGRGGSSAMPHKRNPVGAAAVSTAVRRAHALLPVLYGAMVAEHERDLGGWQAEWETLSELLALAGGAVAHTADTVAGLEVHAGAMAANLARTGGALLSERVASALADHLDPEAARAALTTAGRAAAQGDDFADALLAVPDVAGVVDRPALDALLDPTGYLGSAGTFVDRALASHAERREDPGATRPGGLHP